MTPEKQQERVRSSFAKQGLMTTLGATLSSVSPGMVEIALSPHPAISQQHGFVHAGAVHQRLRPPQLVAMTQEPP